MQILSPSRRSWRANGRDGLRRGLRLGERVFGHGRGQHAPARPRGRKATIETWKQGWISRGWPIVWRRAAIPPVEQPERSCTPRRLPVLRSCALEPVASARGFE
jgi:hypothetical protein